MLECLELVFKKPLMLYKQAVGRLLFPFLKETGFPSAVIRQAKSSTLESGNELNALAARAVGGACRRGSLAYASIFALFGSVTGAGGMTPCMESWDPHLWLTEGIREIAIATALLLALLLSKRLARHSSSLTAKTTVPLSSSASNHPPASIHLSETTGRNSSGEVTAGVQPNRNPFNRHLDERSSMRLHPTMQSSDVLHLWQSLTQHLSEAPDFSGALQVALRQICEVTHWDYGEVWLPCPDRKTLTWRFAWHGDTVGLERFRQARASLTFSPNLGLPGRAWTSRQPEWLEPISPQAVAATAREAGLKVGLAVPVLVGTQVQAVLTFFMGQSSLTQERWVALVTAVATQLGLIGQRQQLEAELRQSRECCRAIVEDQTELICRFAPDGTLTFINDAYCRYLGQSRETLLSRDVFQLLPPEYQEKTRTHLHGLTSTKTAATREWEVAMPNGKSAWQQWTDRAIFDEEGQLIEFQSVGRDITERRQAERESARLASFALLTPNPIVETDLVGRVRYLNPEAMRLLPELQEQGIEHPFLAGVPEMRSTLQRQGSVRRELKLGEVYYEQVLHYVAGTESLLVYAFDITERKRAEEQLIYSAFYDRLTGLSNRALFMDRLRQAMRRNQQRRDCNSIIEPYRFAVLFLNINRFKVINDSLGTQVGDHLLQCFAQRLQSCLRPTDTVARLGGDEFSILLEGIEDVSDAINVAEVIEQMLIAPFYLDESEVFVTVSIGIALNSITSDEQPEDLLRDADIAMYRAKAQGKSCYEIFDAAMYAQAVDRLKVETDLRRAIARDEFRVYYQPIVSLFTGRITGFEALLRWQHPQRGIVSPSEFIPIAEETGLITPIGWWTLESACRQLSLWQQQFPDTQPLTVNVNLSCKQFTQPDLLQRIDRILEETQLAPGSLKLEITESVVMDNPDLVRALLLRLKKRQINLCIDDFGTGYSSLSRLHHFPISTLKIDRSFVSRIGALGENSEIVQAIVMLAQTLSMDVVAEGIEDSEQVSPLIALQCEYGQGYFFSKPVDSESASALLEAEWQRRDG